MAALRFSFALRVVIFSLDRLLGLICDFSIVHAFVKADEHRYFSIRG